MVTMVTPMVTGCAAHGDRVGRLQINGLAAVVARCVTIVTIVTVALTCRQSERQRPDDGGVSRVHETHGDNGDNGDNGLICKGKTMSPSCQHCHHSTFLQHRGRAAARRAAPNSGGSLRGGARSPLPPQTILCLRETYKLGANRLI